MQDAVALSHALKQYRQRAGAYDLELAAMAPLRRSAIARLAPAPGSTVLDVGCGTGLSFGDLEAAVGAQGHVVGIEPCPQMLAQARQRVQRAGWANVRLLQASAQSACIPGQADAALFLFTHDVLRSAVAVRLGPPGARGHDAFVQRKESTMSNYPTMEHQGFCVSVSTKKEPTGRWMAWVHMERGADFARLKGHDAPSHRVPNDFPSEESSVLGAYAYARQRIDEGWKPD